MGKLVVNASITLDGVMQAPGAPDEDRDGGFPHGGWLVPYVDHDFRAVMIGGMVRAGGFLLGRRTYEIFAAHWPHITDAHDPIAAGLNTLPKYVVSTTLAKEELTWRNSFLLEGETAEAVADLKFILDEDLHVHGSGRLTQTLLRHHLVDELRVLVAPVLLGTGKRLFEHGTVPTALRLTDSRTSGTGVTLQTYEREGPPSYGSFAR